MVKRATYGSVRRLGSRYGRTVRFKLGKIEAEQRKKHKCPYCNYIKVRRVSAGIWHCKKCKSTFTNKAYTVGKISPIRQVVEEETKIKTRKTSKKEVKEEKAEEKKKGQRK
ncbi:50S ribosomal protein L37ae [Candidatus Woesearchaeota archaeon]|nr:50S ribosomal protein L37ae [Candidatus Woesearchaeota archaeon]